MEFCGKTSWLVLLRAMVVLGHVLGTNGCFEKEKSALLDFKASYASESYALPSWLNDPKTVMPGYEYGYGHDTDTDTEIRQN